MNAELFVDALSEAYMAQERVLREDFARSLPFQDAMFDRWERARRLGFGSGASIYNSALVFGNVVVGESTWVGPYTLLDGSAGLSIGRYCSISAGVQIYTHDTVAWALTGGQAERRLAPCAIGDYCYIGSQSIVAAGVTIGRQCVVAANSFVNRSVEDGLIVGGSPARRLGRVVVNGDEVAFDYD